MKNGDTKEEERCAKRGKISRIVVDFWGDFVVLLSLLFFFGECWLSFFLVVRPLPSSSTSLKVSSESWILFDRKSSSSDILFLPERKCFFSSLKILGCNLSGFPTTTNCTSSGVQFDSVGTTKGERKVLLFFSFWKEGRGIVE